MYVGVFGREREQAARDPGEVEQIVDDARLEFDAAPQHSHIGAQRGRNFLARFPKIQRGQDRRKGSAQLVGEHGEKLVFCLVSGLGRVFGREHFLLGPLLLGEIAEDEHDAANTALAVADGSAAVVDRNFAAVFPNQQGVIRQTDDHAFPDHLIDRALYRRASVLVQDPKNFRRRAPYRVTQSPTSNFLGHRVHKRNTAFVVGNQDAIADAREGDAE
jgi:hypothetical protein